MKLLYKGQTQTFSIYGWHDAWGAADPEKRTKMAMKASEGAIFTDAGAQLTGRVLQRVRDRLLGTYDDLPEPSGRRQVPAVRRFLIPGLWPWATKPVMGGNYKAGKSTVVCDLVPALLVPGYRFLDHFGPVEGMVTFPDNSVPYDPEHDLGRGVWVINAETPPEDFQQPWTSA